jgi:hypothetical protein
MTKPSTRPLAFFNMVAARTLEAMMARNFGRASSGRSTSMYSRGTNFMKLSSPGSAPVTGRW